MSLEGLGLADICSSHQDPSAPFWRKNWKRVNTDKLELRGSAAETVGCVCRKRQNSEGFEGSLGQCFRHEQLDKVSQLSSGTD